MASAATVVLALTGGSLGCALEHDAGVSTPERILLVSMDTVRADHVSGYGVTDTMPGLSRIAAEGVLFRNAYAASSYTIPSHMSIFTGLDVEEHGVHRREARVAPEIPTLAQALRRAGYRTQGFHEGGYVDARFGFDRGFDEYREYPRGAVVGRRLEDVLGWMRDQGERRYFLFLHTYAAHFPYGGFARYRSEHPERGLPSDAEIARLRRRHPPQLRWDHTLLQQIPEGTRSMCTLYNQLARSEARLLGCGYNHLPPDFPETPHFEADIAAIAASYDGRIRTIDQALMRIRATLSELGQWHDTLLIVTSDHGESFYEHGLQKHDYVPFNEVLKVPLVISYPRLLRGAPVREVEGLVWHLDLMPTVLALAGLPYSGGLRGLDLSGVMTERVEIPGDRTLFPGVLRPAHLPPRPLRRVVLQGGLKYIQGHEHFGDARGFLFDLDRDPEERRNLISSRPGEVDALSARLRDYAARLDPHPPVHQATGQPLPATTEDPGLGIDLSKEQEDRLRSLGYAQ